MIKSSKKISAVVDNWLLELASRLLDKTIENYQFEKEFLQSNDPYLEFYGYFDFNGYQKIILYEKALSLLQLLDLLVLNDEIIYDSTWTYLWIKSEKLKPILPILTSLEIENEDRKKLNENWKYIIEKGNHPDLIKDGALYYLKLSQILGVYYWPAPQRAEFLSLNNYSKIKSGFVLQLKKYIDSNLEEIIKKTFYAFKSTKSFFNFPGFGSSILQNCVTREDIIPITMQFRNSKECIAFRNWLKEMDCALEKGDIKVIANEIQKLNDILESTLILLGIKNKQTHIVEFQLGLSPTIKLSTNFISSFLKKFKPKPYHIIFLRNYFERVLTNTNTLFQLKRLFPEVKRINFENIFK